MLNDIKCQVCNKNFTPQKITTRFCSTTCCNKSRGFFFKNPMFCEWCKKKIDRPCPSKNHRFCSKHCEMEWRRKDRIEIECKICHKKFMVTPTVLKNGRKFCSRKCMGVEVRNTHWNYSPQYRSFGECAMVCLLRKNYPLLKIVPNERVQLEGFEIDIWLPELNAGIEYNGQHHFKPVYGEKVFVKTKKSDAAKKAIAARKGIKMVYIFPDGTVSKTSKTKIKTMFVNCCKEVGLNEPT